MLLWDYVYDITKLLVSRPPHAAKSILSVAGKDISHLFEHGRSLGISDLNVREFSIGTASHPITALIAPRSGLRALAFPSRQAPDDRTDKAPLSPWWQDETLIVGRLASKLRKIIVKNVLTGHEHFMEVPSEEILADVRKRYLEFCLLYTSPSPRDISGSRMPSSACRLNSRYLLRTSAKISSEGTSMKCS